MSDTTDEEIKSFYANIGVETEVIDTATRAAELPFKLVSDLIVYTGDLKNDHVIMLHNNTDTVKVPFSIFNAESNIPSVPSSPTADGSLGDIVADDTAVYTYANGQWGKTPRNLDWGTEYLRIDPNSPTLTATQTETLQRILPKASDTPGIIRLAEDPTEIYVDDQSYATTPAYVRGYVAVAVNDASGADITSNYLPNDTVYAITGKGVSEALDTLDIPEVVSTYSPTDEKDAVSGKAIANALTIFKSENITSTYDSTGTQAITGIGVATAIETASQDIINQVNNNIEDSYDPTSTKAISGKGVALAVSGVVMPSISDEYDPNNHTSGVTGHAVSDALNTLDIPEITSTYNASDTTAGTSGAAVAKAIAAIPNATATARGMVKLGVSGVLSGDKVKGIGINANGGLAVDTYGLSAYEIAVQEGFEGTEEEWLASLDGKSAYEIAVENGFEGTEEEWLESLKGAKGDPGDLNYDAAFDLIEDIIYIDDKTFTTIDSASTSNIVYRWAQLSAPTYCPSASRLKKVTIPCRATASAELTTDPVYLAIFEHDADGGSLDSDYIHVGTSLNAVAQVLGQDSVWEFDDDVILSGRTIRISPMPNRTTNIISSSLTLGSFGRGGMGNTGCLVRNTSGANETYKAAMTFEVESARFATNNMGNESVVYLTAAEKVTLDSLLTNATALLALLPSTQSEEEVAVDDTSTTEAE